MLKPLKIEIKKNLRPTIALILEGKHDLFLGNKKPILSDDVLITDPMDAVILLSALNVNAENELSGFNLRREILTQIENRLTRSSKSSTKTAYSQLLDHARSTFSIGSILIEEKQTPRRPSLRSQPPQLQLVPAITARQD